MRQFIFAFATLVAVANAAHYGSSGYGAAPSHSIQHPPAVVYNIPPPAVLNPVPGPLPGPLLHPIGLSGSISGSASPGALIGVPSNANAAASASSANVPLKPGKYALLVVPSYEVSNAPVEVAPSYGSGHAAAPHY